MEYLLQYGLVAVFFTLITTPVGMPIPEDLSLLAAGVLVATGHADMTVALIVGYIGVVGGDVIAWSIGRKVGMQPTGFIARLVGPEDLNRIERFFRRYGNWAIVIARQFPGMRTPAFFFSGASGIPLGRFLAYDGTAALITTGVFVSLGNAFADDLGRVLEFLDSFRLLGSTVFGTLLALVIWRVVRQQMRRRQANADAAAAKIAAEESLAKDIDQPESA